jgi:hypothetical protein
MDLAGTAMSKTKGKTKHQAERARAAMLSRLNDFDPDHLVLSHDEIRLLALIISTRDGAQPFIRRMVNISESLKAGRTDAVARLAQQSKDQTLMELLAPMSQAVGEGRIAAARNTAFLAAGFAYQNSLDYIRGLMKYLEGFKRRRRTRNRGGGLRPA